MPGPQAGSSAYEDYLSSIGVKRKRKTGILNDALKIGETYGLPVALGAGAGFLTAGPVGAAVGAATGAASAYAGPKARGVAAKAGLPDWAQTAAEYGTYGALAPLGLGAGAGAAAEGVSGLASRVALPAALRLAGKTAVGAVAGQEAAKALGVPEGVGELVGSLFAPTGGEMAWRSARKSLYKVAEGTEPGIKRQIAIAMGETEQVSPKADPLRAKVASVEHNIASLNAEAEHLERRAASYTPTVDDNHWRAITGGWTQEDALRIIRGQPVGVERQLRTSPEYVRIARRLPTQFKAVNEAAAAEASANAAMEPIRAKVIGDLQPEGELVASKDFYLWRDATGAERAVPDEDAAAYLAARKAQGQASQRHESARLRVSDSTGLPPDALPGSLDELQLALKNKHLPDYQPDAQIPSPDEMRPRYAVGLKEAEAYEMNTAQKTRNDLDKARKLRELAKDMPAIGKAGAIPSGKQGDAANLWDFIKKLNEMRWTVKPDGTRVARSKFNVARESMEGFGDYVKFAALSARAHPENQDTFFKTFFESPRGTVTRLGRFGESEPKSLVGLVPPEGVDEATAWTQLAKDYNTEGWSADVRSTFQSADEADRVPLDELVMRYDKNTHAARAAEWAGTAQRMFDAVTAEAEKLKLSPKQLEAAKARVQNAIDQIAQPEPASTETWYATRKALLADKKAVENARGRALAKGEDPALLPPEVPLDAPVIDEMVSAKMHDFLGMLTPEEATVEGAFNTLEDAEKVRAGMENFAAREARGGATPEEAAVVAEERMKLMQTAADRHAELWAVHDPELMGMADNPVDPMRDVYRMLGTARSESLDIINQERPKLAGAVRQWLNHAATGVSVTDPTVQGLLGDYFGHMEGLATQAEATHGSLIVGLRQAAYKEVGEVASAGASFGKKARHPLSQGDKELTDMMRADFSLDGLRRSHEPIYQQMAKDAEAIVAKYGQERLDQLVSTVIATNPAMLAEMAPAFPTLSRKDWAQSFTRMWNGANAENEMIARALGSAPLSAAQKWSLQTTQEFRKYLEQDVIKRPEMNVFKLASQLLKAADEKAGVPGRALSDLMVSGQEAAMATPIAAKHSEAITHFTDQLTTLGKGVDRNEDIIFRGGEWQVRSLNKFPAQMRESISAAADILSGKNTGLDTVVRASQQIALGTLAADMSLVGIHGFKVLAQGLLSGHPVEAIKVLKTGLGHIMTDVGFHSWLRANHDDLAYLAQFGHTGGLKGYIAGPDITKMPLESIPLLGRVFTGIRNFSDLQYDRMLYYWKTESIRMNMEFAQNLKMIGNDFHQKFLDSSPNSLHSKIVADMGGMDAYKYGSTDDLAKAVVRQVNNSLGGINLRAKGVSPTRQALEQIAFIVPGFTRAQIGQWASIITKPGTTEGWLAASMVGREMMFGGSIAIGMSRMLGTEHQLNLTDPSKSDFLAVHLPGGGYFSVMSTMAIPRLLSRSVNETLSGAAGVASGQGGGFNYMRSLEAFAHGRLSAGAGALYDFTTNKDFLGRNYTSTLDRFSAVMEHTVLPITLQSVIDDVKEGFRSGGVDGREIALDTAAQIIGKGFVPEAPRDKLNAFAQQSYQTDWALLTDQQKDAMRKANPGVAATEAEFNYFSARRATTSEAHVDAAYKQYADTKDEIQTGPMMYKNLKTSQLQDDQLLNSGAMSGDDWRERYHRRQDAISDAYDSLQKQLKAEGIDPEELRKKKLQKLADSHDPNDVAWLLQLGKNEYASVHPATVAKTVSTPAGDIVVDEVDWAGYADSRQAVLNKYPPDVAKAIVAQDPEKTDPGVLAYRQASEAQKLIEATPRYRGLSVDQSDKLDNMRSVLNATRAQISVKMGLPPGTPEPAGVADAAKGIAIQQMQKQGLITDKNDTSLAMLAIMMSGNPALSESLMNPEQVALILKNPQAVVYYPYLQYRVPKTLRNRLPQQSQPLAQQAGTAHLQP